MTLNDNFRCFWLDGFCPGAKPDQDRSPPGPQRQERYARDNETLRLQIQSLQSQLEEQTKLAKEQIEALEADRRVKIEEYDARRERDEEKIKTLTEKWVSVFFKKYCFVFVIIIEATYHIHR